MFFLSLLPLASNIARRDMSLGMIFGQKCLFSQNSSKRAYLFGVEHIKLCNPEYANDCRVEEFECQWSPKPNSRDKKRQIAILK